MKEKTVQIDKKAFLDMYVLINELYYGLDMSAGAKERIESLYYNLEAKMQALLKREAFTRYKTSEPNSKQREELRREYLERAGIQKNWTTDREVADTFKRQP